MKLTQDQINWLNKVVNGTWEYENGEVNVIGDVVVSTSIPVQFGYVTGYFDCGYSKITSLKGCPREVGGYFSCSGTKITSLKGCPREVSGDFWCPQTKITSLEHAPREIGGWFSCRNTNIKGKPDASHIQIGGGLFWK